MPIKIHHGPPGSYKTSGAVMDDLIPAAKAGRVVVTNVRGISSREHVIEVLGDLPETFDLVYLQTTECDKAMENRRWLSTFWHWAPEGAFLLIDECNTIWPTSLRDKDIEALNYPDSYLNGGASNRPHTMLTAFEMHRHLNWDIVLTTPHIDKVHKYIRQCAEGAYKHKNQALIGLKGRYLEAFHLAEDSGRNASDFLTVRNRKISKVTWALYQSTATGAVQDTIAGTSLWKNPRVLFFLVLVAGLLVFLSFRKAPTVLSGEKPAAHLPVPAAPAAPARPGPPLAVPPSNPPIPADGRGAVYPVKVDSPGGESHPLNMFTWSYSGYYKLEDRAGFNYLFKLRNDGDVRHISYLQLYRMGYRVTYIGDCIVKVTYQAIEFMVFCAPSGTPADGLPEVVKRRTASQPLAALLPSP